ncbi:DUF624 domain-containing protein [Fundicoccus sp. Sow4_D5]|uniref:DUF624 domain-containing protein n=1 Tax=Fundicoccus sp. Sow4_D5 TaxID=3438782 RepID=UPI003F8E196A
MFSIDGKLYAFSMRLYRLIILNALFVIGCLPIVTIGASFTALVSVTHHDERQMVRAFFKTYRQEIWVTLPYLFFHLMSALFIQSLRMADTGASRLLYYISLCFIFFVLTYNLNLYVAHVLHPKTSVFKIFQYSFFLTIWSFYKTFWIPVMMGLAIWYLYQLLGLMILLVLFSLPIWLHLLLIEQDAQRVSEYFVKLKVFNVNGK